MKKFVVVFVAVMLTVLFCGVLCADDDNDHPVKTWTDDYVKNMNFFRDSPDLNKTPAAKYRESAKSNAKKSADSKSSDGWHSKAKYRVTEWLRKGNKEYTIKYEDKNGKVYTVNGVSNEGITLRKPIQLTVPNWVTQVHVHYEPNYEILDDGSLNELEYVEKKGDDGKLHKFRIAYPGDKVLIVNGDGLTTWVRQ